MIHDNPPRTERTQEQMAAYDALPESPVSRDPSFALVSEAAHLELTDPEGAEVLWERVRKSIRAPAK